MSTLKLVSKLAKFTVESGKGLGTKVTKGIGHARLGLSHIVAPHGTVVVPESKAEELRKLTAEAKDLERRFDIALNGAEPVPAKEAEESEG